DPDPAGRGNPDVAGGVGPAAGERAPARPGGKNGRQQNDGDCPPLPPGPERPPGPPAAQPQKAVRRQHGETECPDDPREPARHGPPTPLPCTRPIPRRAPPGTMVAGHWGSIQA